MKEIKMANFHLRSISLPSKSHPLTAVVEEQLSTLRSSKATSNSVNYKLASLKNLYETVDDLLHLPFVQQALSGEHHNKSSENLLEGSLEILDVCGTTRDVFSLMKECIQELESSIRRKRGGDSNFENEVGAYMTCRKRLDKMISKSLVKLKRMEKKGKTSSLDMDFAAVSQLKEIEGISLVVFESLLSFLSRPKARTNGWSKISKLLQSKRISSEEQADANEVEKMDTELLVLMGKKSSPVQAQNVSKGLKALERSIQEIEEELESVYRRLLKTRVSLLNILKQ